MFKKKLRLYLVIDNKKRYEIVTDAKDRSDLENVMLSGMRYDTVVFTTVKGELVCVNKACQRYHLEAKRSRW